jgi:hypothetical protein
MIHDAWNVQSHDQFGGGGLSSIMSRYSSPDTICRLLQVCDRRDRHSRKCPPRLNFWYFWFNHSVVHTFDQPVVSALPRYLSSYLSQKCNSIQLPRAISTSMASVASSPSARHCVWGETIIISCCRLVDLQFHLWGFG